MYIHLHQLYNRHVSVLVHYCMISSNYMYDGSVEAMCYYITKPSVENCPLKHVHVEEGMHGDKSTQESMHYW